MARSVSVHFLKPTKQTFPAVSSSLANLAAWVSFMCYELLPNGVTNDFGANLCIEAVAAPGFFFWGARSLPPFLPFLLPPSVSPSFPPSLSSPSLSRPSQANSQDCQNEEADRSSAPPLPYPPLPCPSSIHLPVSPPLSPSLPSPSLPSRPFPSPPLRSRPP